MNFAKIMENILVMVLPFIKDLISSKVVPILKRKAYQRLDDFTNDVIENLAQLVEKIKKETNTIKREAHLEGFRLGIKTLRAIAKKIIDACDLMEEEI